MAISEARKNFRMPQVRPMTPVLLSRSSRFSDPMYGIVVSVNQNAIDAIAFHPQSLQPTIPFFDCPHVSDPLVAEKPKLIQERDQCGVWDFSDQLRTDVEFRTRLQHLEEEIRQLWAAMKMLQETIKAPVASDKGTSRRPLTRSK